VTVRHQHCPGTVTRSGRSGFRSGMAPSHYNDIDCFKMFHVEQFPFRYVNDGLFSDTKPTKNIVEQLFYINLSGHPPQCRRC
jgi:hypothetical protein